MGAARARPSRRPRRGPLRFPEGSMTLARSSPVRQATIGVAVGFALAFTLALRAAGVAWAETPPSVWDVAKDPAERDRWALHVRVDRLIPPPIGEGAARLDDDLRLEAARAMLEEADAARSPDVRLRFDLGVVYSAL